VAAGVQERYIHSSAPSLLGLAPGFNLLKNVITMKQHKIIIFPALLMGILICYSCNKNFLNRYPEANLTQENFFANGTDLNTYCNGLYSYVYDAQTILGNDGQSDNYEGIPFNRVVAGQLTLPATASAAGWTWNYLSQVNYFLQNYQKAVATDAVKNHYAGVARFFRAWFYFDMVKRFGDVPWYGTPILPNDSTDLYKGRDPRALVMDSVLADLRFAAGNMNSTGPSGTITKWTALALLARVGLHEGTFREYRSLAGSQTFLQVADSAALVIMQSAQFKLYSTGNPAQDYYNLFNIFSPSDPQNGEVILGVYHSQALKSPTPVNYWDNGGNYGWGLTKDLVNSYLMKDGTPFTALMGYDTLPYTKEFNNRDPRLLQTVVNPFYLRQGASYVPLLGIASTGYQIIKYYVDDPLQDAYNNTFDAVIDFRYGEVLLVYAEARAELGLLTQSDLDMSVNLLRDRVQMPHMTLNGIPDPVLMAMYPLVSGSQQYALLEIRRERRVELACEGFRYDDLMRWRAGSLMTKPFTGMYFPGLGSYDLNGDGKIDYTLVTSLPAVTDPLAGSYKVIGTDFSLTQGNKGNVLIYPNLVKTFADPKNYFFPLPTAELLLNKNLTQNPGW
jgi:starch-binding outer membrane protein, SusD/RagB family